LRISSRAREEDIPTKEEEEEMMIRREKHEKTLQRY